MKTCEVKDFISATIGNNAVMQPFLQARSAKHGFLYHPTAQRHAPCHLFPQDPAPQALQYQHERCCNCGRFPLPGGRRTSDDDASNDTAAPVFSESAQRTTAKG